MTVALRLPPAIQSAVDQTRERLETELSTNARLRWLIAGGVIVLYLGIVLTVSNQISTARSDLHQINDRLARLEAQSAEAAWPERSKQAQSLAADLSRRLWSGETPGLAEAGFERWIRQQFEQEGVDIRQVQLTRAPAIEDRGEVSRPTLADVQRIRAKVVGELNEAALMRFLAAAADNQAWIIAEQLIVRSGRNARFELDLAVFYRPGAPGA